MHNIIVYTKSIHLVNMSVGRNNITGFLSASLDNEILSKWKLLLKLGSSFIREYQLPLREAPKLFLLLKEMSSFTWRYNGTSPYFQVFLQRDKTFVPFCTPFWKWKPFKLWSTKGQNFILIVDPYCERWQHETWNSS